MRYIFIFVLLSQVVYGQHEDGNCKDIHAIIEMESHTHESKLLDYRNEATENYNLIYQRLEWEVDPAVKYIQGEITSYFHPLEANFDQINFDFSSSMQVNAIIYHGDSLDYTFSDEYNLQIDIPAPIDNDIIDSITVIYEGVPTSVGFGSFEATTHNGTPVLWTLSEPYGAKDWWPCKQDLNDKMDSIDIYIKTPNVYKAASNGILMEEILEDDLITYHWKHRYAIPAYLVAIAVTDYAVYSDYVPYGDGDSIEVLNYVFPENLEVAKTQTAEIVEIMTLFNDLFGLYPFAEEKYGHAQFGWGGGMEHQTMSFMGGFSYNLQAHELAHQWFGDKITCGSWEDIWLNEGFATYLTGLTKDFLGSEEDFYEWNLSKINSITSQPGGSVWVNDTTSVGRIFNSRLSYNKGSMLLHMLRWKLGDDNFFEAIRNYISDPNLAFGYAKTEDLQAHLEAIGEEDLDEFFNDWFYNQGYPSYHASWWKTSEGISIKMDQTTSHESVPFFEMPVPIFIEGEGMDTIISIDHNSQGQVFEIDLPFEAENISIDPDLWLISADNTVEELSTGIQHVTFSSLDIVAYPNPFSNHINFTFESTIPERIDIYDMTSRKVASYTDLKSMMHLSTSTLQSGLYMVRIISGNQMASTLISKL